MPEPIIKATPEERRQIWSQAGKEQAEWGLPNRADGMLFLVQACGLDLTPEEQEQAREAYNEGYAAGRTQ